MTYFWIKSFHLLFVIAWLWRKETR